MVAGVKVGAVEAMGTKWRVKRRRRGRMEGKRDRARMEREMSTIEVKGEGAVLIGDGRGGLCVSRAPAACRSCLCLCL